MGMQGFSQQLWKFKFLCLLVLAFALSGVVSLNEEGQLLLQFKQSIVDPDGLLSNWNNSDSSPCQWSGVNCTSGFVTSINLYNNNLTGPLPVGVFGKLTNLIHLDLGNTNLNGSIPSDLVNCSNLVYLKLSQTYMGGDLPQDISKLVLLQYLDLEFASFGGTLPDSICDLPNLLHLGLTSNLFNGSIPDRIGNMTKLQYLSLNDNPFVGPLPSSISKLKNLREIYVGLTSNFTVAPMPDFGDMVDLEVLSLVACQFTAGPFPSWVEGMTKLTKLEFTNCNLEGPIPQFLQNMTGMMSLNLNNNSLNGTIPDIFGGMKNLVEVGFEVNMFTGTIPASLWQCMKLEHVELWYNSLTGSLPEEIGYLTNLMFIDVTFNNLSGPIPASLGNLTNLQHLFLSQNQFTGEIPPGVSNFTNLQGFLVFENQISGTVPYDFGARITGLGIFDVSRNLLEGLIPPSLCNGDVLTYLRFGGNRFTGGIPDTYGNCTSLQNVEFNDNQLEGPIPRGMWGASQMNHLFLQNNRFNGSIAPIIGQATNFSVLRIENNDFTGPLPAEIGQTNLTKFHAFGNKLDGPPPPQLGNLTQLMDLSLANNSFNGSIPSALGNCTALNQLDISHNHLAGSIPEELGHLQYLVVVDMSFNDLVGPIPPSLFKMTQLETLNVAYNELSGVVPEGLQTTVNITGNPYLCEANNCPSSIPPAAPQTTSRNKKIAWVVGVTFAVAAVVLVVGSYLFVRRYRIVFESNKNAWLLTSFQNRTFQDHEVTELEEDNVVGSGGSGKVYRAILDNGDAVAVKKLKRDAGSDDHGFKSEVSTLGSIRHRNIVRLLCCCSNKDSNLLVYEYMPNGSLGDILHSTEGEILTWDMRYKIALGAAKGLEYLHHDCTPQILHRDIKSNNILLDAAYEAHLADFGIAKIVDPTALVKDMSKVAGSLGYIAPEYAFSLKVDEKSDIYSFGVVLLELVTGKRPVGNASFGDCFDLVNWVCNKVQSQEGYHNILDSRCGQDVHDDMVLVLRVGLLCTSFLPLSRPSMREVVLMLRAVAPQKELEKNGIKVEEQALAIKVEEAVESPVDDVKL